MTEFFQSWAYPGLFLGSFLAATVVPFSSDVLLLAALAGGSNPVAAVSLAAAGNWLGGLSSYWLGWLGKLDWLEKWFRVRHEKLEKQRSIINKYGNLMAFFTWLPGIGDVLAIALGFYKVDFKKSALFMFIGKSTRYVAWAIAFYYAKEFFEAYMQK
jgi:membrane protein YqaA with SNARE-associated domain